MALMAMASQRRPRPGQGPLLAWALGRRDTGAAGSCPSCCVLSAWNVTYMGKVISAWSKRLGSGSCQVVATWRLTQKVETGPVLEMRDRMSNDLPSCIFYGDLSPGSLEAVRCGVGSFAIVLRIEVTVTMEGRAGRFG